MIVLKNWNQQSEIIFNRKVILFFLAVILDAILTVYLMTKGFGEANPIMNSLANMFSSTHMAIFKIIWTLILLMFIVNTKEFRKYINYLIIGYAIMYFGGWLVQIIWEIIR